MKSAKMRFEIINHGYCSSDYFQGCGTAFTEFTHVVTGGGQTAAEAYRHAVEQVYQSELTDAETARLKLPKRPRGCGITERAKVPAACHEGVYWYVSIRFK